MLITIGLIRQGESGTGGFNKEQFSILKIPYPPKAGWIGRILGEYISREDAAKYVRLRGHTRKRNAKIKKGWMRGQTEEYIKEKIEEANRLADAILAGANP